MKKPSSTTPAGDGSLLFDPLEQTVFLRLKHAASLKGLLRPFKGKGELTIWANECEGLQDSLMVLAQRLLSQATAYPFNLLPVMLAQQTTGAGTTFLRWRNADRSAMGVSLWAQLINHPSTPELLIHQLFELELQRTALNMQISLIHSIARQARECAGKMGYAEAVYQRRRNNRVPTTPQETPS